MEAHLFAAALEDPKARPPFIALLVSGGHTLLLRVPQWGEYHLLGATRDDAVGEAFDKAAKLLGLPYPGGPQIQRAAAAGDPKRYPLPRPLLARNQVPGTPDYYDMSYSGLKTALRTRVSTLRQKDALDGAVPDLAAAFQDAAVDVLVSKTLRAVDEFACARVVLGGGVANSLLLQSELRRRLPADGVIFVPSPRLSTDNAAMVARAGVFHHARGERDPLDLNARADLPFPGMRQPT